MSESKFSPIVKETLQAYGTRDASGVRRAHVGFTLKLHDTTRSIPTRAEREEHLNSLLASGATKAFGAGNRNIEEEPDPIRTCFERDLDRIKHHAAFRTLAGKCQVFVAPDDLRLRNRLTHSLEVAQVAAGIASSVGANATLAEAAALGHDCGHGPMGHAAEDAFTPFLTDGYDHAPYGAYVMLKNANLCVETIDAIANHSWRRPAPSTVEGEIVSFSDRIAYVCHDFDDACVAGVVTSKQLPEIVADTLGVKQSTQLRTLINAVVQATTKTGVVGLEEPYATALDAFRKFNYDNIYLRPASQKQNEKAVKVLTQLVEYYVDVPGKIPQLKNQPASGSALAAEHAVHYVAQLTDQQVLNQATILLGWSKSELPRGV